MKNLMKLGYLLLVLVGTTLTAQARSIEIAGLVVDAETMKPLANASIYDETGKLLSKTDTKGYYNLTLDQLPDTGELYFSLQFKKASYADFVQKEHWGDLPTGVISSLYVGMQKNNSDAETFSQLEGTTDLSLANIQAQFEHVKTTQALAKQLAKAKKDNEKVVFTVANNHYIVSNTGWIRIQSLTDKVSINGTKAISASQLNTQLKRSAISGLSQFEKNGHTTYIVYTNAE